MEAGSNENFGHFIETINQGLTSQDSAVLKIRKQAQYQSCVQNPRSPNLRLNYSLDFPEMES